MRLKSRIIDYLFIIIVAVLAYWPASFMLFSVKNDAINYFLAMRYNTSEALQNGVFPTWSPFINLGYPIHGDVQSGVWNPVVLVMSLIRKYDIYWLQLETIVTIIISGISMYHLLNYFKLNRRIVLTVAAAYMMNGFITDSGQFLNWLYAAAYLPFVFLATIRCFTTFSIKDALILGVAYSLMLLSAYPSDFIQLSYILFAFVVIFFIKSSNKKNIKTNFFLFAKQSFIFLGAFFIICLPAIISYVPFIRSINRGAGVNLETALMNSMSPVNFISFIAPWPTLNLNWHQYTDPLVRNCYTGIILFLFFLSSTFSKRKRTFLEWFLTGVFLFFLLFSLGEAGWLRVISFNYLPLMNTFRHPANAKLFFIFAAQVISALAINDYFTKIPSDKDTLRKLSVLFLIIVFTSAVYSIFKSEVLQVLSSSFRNGIDRTQLKSFRNNLNFYDLLLLNSLLLLTVIFITYRLIKSGKLKKYFPFLVFAEMFIVAQGMLPLTFVRSSSPSAVQQIIDLQPKGYPVPDVNTSIADFSVEGKKYFELLGGLNPYNKKPGRIDYIITPANLSSQESFWDYKAFRNKIIQYPLIYFADTIYSIQDTALFVASASSDKAVILETSAAFQPKPQNNRDSIQITKFRPGYVSLKVICSKQSLLVFQQNYYYPWEAIVNDKKTEIHKANISFMALEIPAGSNTIEFVYRVKYLTASIVFSLAFLILALIYIYHYSKKK